MKCRSGADNPRKIGGDNYSDTRGYIALVQRKPGALRNGSPFTDMFAPLKQFKLGLLRHPGGPPCQTSCRSHDCG